MQFCSRGLPLEDWIPLKPIVESGGRGQPRKQGNSMEEITQDVAIQTKIQMQLQLLITYMNLLLLKTQIHVSWAFELKLGVTLNCFFIIAAG